MDTRAKKPKAAASKADSVETRELFEVVIEASDRSFQKADEFSAQFQKAMSDLRKEALDAWKTSARASLDVQAEIARSMGLTPKVPREIEEMILSSADAWAKAQNDLSNASINATRQFVQGYGGAAKAAAELSKSALGLLISATKRRPSAASAVQSA